jgi:hypothetical protein
VILTLGTNHSTNQNKHSQHVVEICIACSLCCTGQTGGHIRCTEMFQEAQWLFLGPGTKTTSESQLEGKQQPPQNLANELETFQELTKSTKPKATHVQRFTYDKSHRDLAPVRPVTHTSQTGQACEAWDEQRDVGQLLQTTFLISRFAPRIHTRLWGY